MFEHSHDSIGAGIVMKLNDILVGFLIFRSAELFGTQERGTYTESTHERSLKPD